MRDDDLLAVDVQHSADTDAIHCRLISRRFRWSEGFGFPGLGAPPEVVIRGAALRTFGPLFRAFADLPFPPAVVGPLLQAFMAPLVARFVEQISIQVRAEANRRAERYRPDRIVVDDIEATTGTTTFTTAVDLGFQPGDILRVANERQLQNYAQMLQTPVELRFAELFEQRAIEVENQAGPAVRGLAYAMEQAFIGGLPYRNRAEYERATARSRETLLNFLSEDQRLCLERNNYFWVVSSAGRRFKVLQKASFNVADERDVRFCAVPDGHLPIYDRMLAAKVWLETDEALFMANANRAGDERGIWQDVMQRTVQEHQAALDRVRPDFFSSIIGRFR